MYLLDRCDTPQQMRRLATAPEPLGPNLKEEEVADFDRMEVWVGEPGDELSCRATFKFFKRDYLALIMFVDGYVVAS